MRTHDTTVTDKIYDALEARKDGLSLQTLAQWLNLKIGTVKKNIKKMEDEFVVIRVQRNDQFVYKLTNEHNITEAWGRKIK